MSKLKTDEMTNPFPGLRPFNESEQHLFFGRESQIDAMVDKLAANRFLAVVGTSGSGKSSLVNCGLRPALRTGLMPGAGTAWRMAQCRPGGDPIGALSKALAIDGVLFKDYQDVGMPLSEIVDTTLRMGKLGLVDIVEQAHLPAGTNLLLVIDQFEELFRYRHLDEHGLDSSSQTSQQAVAFVNLLLSALEQAELPVYVVITMRSDFLGDCAQFTGLAEAINSGQYLVPRMTREQRRAAITGPIGVGDAKVYPALLTRLVNDVGTNPDQLSILQHALNRTWSYWENERGRQGMLDIACYESIGSMSSALDQHADRAFAELGSSEKERICKTLFKALTDKASDARGVRRPTRLGTLCEMCDATPSEVVAVINVFRKPSRSFLMPPEGVELHPDTVIDISHESLMRVWKKLDRWANEEAEAASRYKRLAETSALYKQEHAELLRDADLRVALGWQKQNKPNAVWARQYDPDFDGAMAFLDKSKKSDDMRKRLRIGSVAAVLLFLSGFVVYKITDLSAEKNNLIVAKENLTVELKDVAQEKENLTVELKDVAQEKENLTDELKDVAKEKETLSVELKDVAKAKETLTVELDKSEQQKIEALNEVDQVKNEVQNQLDGSTQQALVDIDAPNNRIAETVSPFDATQQENIAKHLGQLEPPDISTVLQQEIIRLAASVVETADTSEFSENHRVEGTTDIASPVTLDPPNNETVQDTSQVALVPAVPETATVEHQTHLLRFQACENVDKLEPSGCKNDGESFNPGKIFVFARIVSKIEDEELTLQWFRNDAADPFDEKQWTVKPNPQGYRTYTWKNLVIGTYRACLTNQFAQQLECISIPVGIENTVTDAAEDSISDSDTQLANAPENILPAEEINTELSVPPAMAIVQSDAQEPDTAWVPTRLLDTEIDGFVVCRDVDKLEPIDCSTELDPGRVYAFARIVTPLDQETVTLQWFRDDVEIPELRKELEIKKNASGFRTYSWNTFNSGSYAVSLLSQNGEELRKIKFNVKNRDTDLED